MSGSKKLSELEKNEMLYDAKDRKRGEAFLAARNKSHEGSLDDYIEFLSDNMEILKGASTAKRTDNFRL